MDCQTFGGIRVCVNLDESNILDLERTETADQ
jgi:hypothetical protein